MKIAVIGANGHVGANAVREILAAGHEAIGVTRKNSDRRSLQGLDIELRQANVLEPASLLSALAGSTHAINLAALISITMDKFGRVMLTNVSGPRNVAAACLKTGITRLVHVSSIHAFRSTSTMALIDETASRPDENSFEYDRSKYLGEKEIHKAIGQGLDAVILNPTGILGPYDYGTSLSGAMLKKLFSGTLPIIVDGGFDWSDVRDIAQGCVAALTRGNSGENYLLSGHFAKISRLAELCGEISGNPARRLSIPIWSAALGLPFVGAWTKLSGKPALYTRQSLRTLSEANPNISSAKAQTVLGYNSRPLQQTLQDCHTWYLRQAEQNVR